MARFDKIGQGRFRGVVAANLTGVWGSAALELICVEIDASGNLVAAGAGAAKGIIDCTEGKSDSSVANFNVALAGDVYTVLVEGEITGPLDGTPALVAGDEVWSAAAGDVVDVAPGVGQQLLGFVVAGSDGEDRLIINIGGEQNVGT
jgi:hypothetical protein